MGQFIGALGGIMMVILIVALLLQFLTEMGATFQAKSLGLIWGKILSMALFELMICGIYYTARFNGTSILDIDTIWATKTLLFTEFAPGNWYAALFLGVFAYWNLFCILKRYMSEKQAFAGLTLFLIAPGSVLVFLPHLTSIFVFALSLFVRILFEVNPASAFTSKMQNFFEKNTGKEVFQLLYLLLFALFALLNGTYMIWMLGV